jgi:hypothetical protein
MKINQEFYETVKFFGKMSKYIAIGYLQEEKKCVNYSVPLLEDFNTDTVIYGENNIDAIKYDFNGKLIIETEAFSGDIPKSILMESSEQP